MRAMYVTGGQLKSALRPLQVPALSLFCLNTALREGRGYPLVEASTAKTGRAGIALLLQAC
jgi:hypothetical protein